MEAPGDRSARLLAAIPHGHSSPVLENSVFELTSRPICGRLFLLENTGFPPIRLSESPAAKPGFRRFGLSDATAMIATTNRRTSPPTPKPVSFLYRWEEIGRAHDYTPVTN